jgi:predicted porin
MTKLLLALAAVAVCNAAVAQSSVTLFGIVDTNVTHGRASGPGGSRLTQVSNSGYNSSRLGFRGVEDLGGGMTASFWLEAALSTDDGRAGGAVATGNQAVTVAANQGLNFSRRSTVSLAGSPGEIRLGRDYTPTFWNLTVFDPFNTNGAGQTLGFQGPAIFGLAGPAGASGPVGRASNSIGYFAPANLGGFYGQAQYFLGENLRNGAATEDDGSGYGFRVGYAVGPVNASFSYNRTRYARTAATGDFRTWNVAGQWTFGFAKLMATLGHDERDSVAALEGRHWLVGVSVPVGVGEIRSAYSTYQIDRNGAAGTNARIAKMSLGYVHNLSKRTALYATGAHVRNSNGAAFALNGSTFGTGVVNAGSTGWDFGLRHAF